MSQEDYILIKEHDNKVFLFTLNRPKVFNALNDDLIRELSQHVVRLEDEGARAFVLTGNAKAFAAGGDIAEMVHLDYAQVQKDQYVMDAWSALHCHRVPLIAAVQGLAFGGGNELVLLSDIVIAGRSAVFAQPETSIGVIPGAGGTQRLVRAVGKAKAMEIILAGRQLSALEAERSGLVSRVVDDDQVINEALQVAQNIALRSRPVIEAAKAAVDFAAQSTLKDGLHYEQQRFYGMFALQDQKEGMSAFLEKRKPNWQDK